MIMCWLTKHKYVVLRELNQHNRMIGCKRCYRSWAMNDDTRTLVPWDVEFEELYQELNKAKDA